MLPIAHSGVSGGHFGNDEYIYIESQVRRTMDIYIYRRARCTSRTCGACSGSPQIVSVSVESE